MGDERDFTSTHVRVLKAARMLIVLAKPALVLLNLLVIWSTSKRFPPGVVIAVGVGVTIPIMFLLQRADSWLEDLVKDAAFARSWNELWKSRREGR